MWDWLGSLSDWLGTAASGAGNWLSNINWSDAAAATAKAVGPALATAGISALTRPSPPDNPPGEGFRLPTATAATPTAPPREEPNIWGAPPQNIQPNAGLMIDDRLRRLMAQRREGGFNSGI